MKSPQFFMILSILLDFYSF